MSQVSLLLLGEIDRPEFREPRFALGAAGRIACFGQVESAVRALTQGTVLPDVIVVAQAFPGQFSHLAIDSLRRLAPLAPVLGLLGSWCEGEMRSGKPWPGAIRVYWHQWLPRCRQQLDRLRRGECPAWGLPPTATEEERLLADADDRFESRQGLIAIHTRQYEMADWLSCAFRSRGYATVWLRPSRTARVDGATAAVFAGSECRGEQLEQVRHLCVTVAPAPVVTLWDFPRIEDHRRAISAGAAAVLSKPLSIEDLFWQLERVLDAARSPEPRHSPLESPRS